MLQNRKIAWLITIALMIIGLFSGSYFTFSSMRARVAEGFRAEIEQDLHDKLQMVHNMLYVYLRNGGDNEAVVLVTTNIAEAQQAIDRVSESLAAYSITLTINADSLYRSSAALNLNENDARFMRNFNMDIQEIDLILRQSNYNRFAAGFNEATRRGLGFLTHNNILGYRQMPIFE